MELRQLSYFVAVAEELHFGRAAERLHLAGPSLSQQISNLERELGTQLLVRDRRHVELTPAGSQFLTDSREVLAAAERAFDRARKGAGELPLRLGYVSWLPPEAAAMPDPRIRVDEWVLPSHTQATRVAEGSLDLAIAWIEEGDMERHNLAAYLLWYERLEAVMPRSHQAARHKSVAAADVTVLVDVDEASWLSWNRYASAFAKANQAAITTRSTTAVSPGPHFSTTSLAYGDPCSIRPSATRRRCHQHSHADLLPPRCPYGPGLSFIAPMTPGQWLLGRRAL